MNTNININNNNQTVLNALALSKVNKPLWKGAKYIEFIQDRGNIYVFNLIKLLFCCARLNGRTVRHIRVTYLYYYFCDARNTNWRIVFVYFIYNNSI